MLFGFLYKPAIVEIEEFLAVQQCCFPLAHFIVFCLGKLQVLSSLLRDLFLYKHRCLIFTQMSRMLDVLQAFLSFHGYQYFRLDGTTGIEQRQVGALFDFCLRCFFLAFERKERTLTKILSVNSVYREQMLSDVLTHNSSRTMIVL